jgi:hypothetical protein
VGVSTSGLPVAVERFIAQRIDSVALLEALLLVRAAPDRAWTAEDVGRALVTRPDHGQALLAQLVDQDLVVADGPTYHYAPGDLAADVDALAECYATRRPTVVGLVFAPRDSDAQALADAFRLRRRP